MAIRFPTMHNIVGTWRLESQADAMSGWKSFTLGLLTADTSARTIVAVDRFQPSGMSRPGNLGTAYVGAWTENMTSSNDAHIPIPFKDVVSAVASLIYPTGLTPAIRGM